MGNHKFRLSEMIPNAWFYKLKDIGSRTRRTPKSTKKKKQPPTSSSSSSLTSSSLSSSSSSKATSTSSTTTTTSSIPPQNSKLPNNPHNILSHQRKSYYFTRKLTSLENPKFQAHPTKSPETRFLESPRKSSRQKNSNNAKVRSRAASTNRPPSQKLITTSVSASCGCLASVDLKSDDYPISPLDSSSDPESLFPELGSDQDQNPENDIVIDMNVGSSNAKLDEFNSISKLELPPILTAKQPKSQNSAEFEEINAFSRRSISNFTEQRTSSVSSVRRLSVSSPGVRLRTNSPRIGTRRVQGNGRKSVSAASSGCRSRRSVSESFAVVKSSADPRRDFRESMVEMIVENNIRSSKDLEDLLACYLQLNSDEYHEMIIKVFKQIWFDLSDIRLNN